MTTDTTPSQSLSPNPLPGLFFGLAAFLIWGLSPVYWKELKQVQPLEIILHRIVWSFFFLIPVIILRGRWQEFIRTLRNPKAVAILLATALFVSSNWLVYIWAVMHNHLLQASLGYYINPLVNILLGTLFLGERLRRLQIVSVALAAAGVLYLTVYYGQFPWISLYLAFSFGFYGLVRKAVDVASMVGLTVETMLLSIPAGLLLIMRYNNQTGAFLRVDLQTDLFLLGASVITSIPLLFFTISARRLTLSTVGFIQYVAPTCMFLLGVLLYREPFATAQIITFLMIWAALVLYSLDSIRFYRHQ